MRERKKPTYPGFPASPLATPPGQSGRRPHIATPQTLGFRQATGAAGRRTEDRVSGLRDEGSAGAHRSRINADAGRGGSTVARPLPEGDCADSGADTPCKGEGERFSCNERDIEFEMEDRGNACAPSREPCTLRIRHVHGQRRCPGSPLASHEFELPPGSKM